MHSLGNRKDVDKMTLANGNDIAITEGEKMYLKQDKWRQQVNDGRSKRAFGYLQVLFESSGNFICLKHDKGWNRVSFDLERQKKAKVI